MRLAAIADRARSAPPRACMADGEYGDYGGSSAAYGGDSAAYGEDSAAGYDGGASFADSGYGSMDPGQSGLSGPGMDAYGDAGGASGFDSYGGDAFSTLRPV